MKSTYVKPKAETFEFETMDVVTTSGGGNTVPKQQNNNEKIEIAKMKK